MSSDPGPSPSFLLCLRDVLWAGRAGWSFRNVLLVFVVVLLASLLGRYALLESHRDWLYWTAVVTGTLVLFVLATALFGMLAGASGWEYGRDCRWTLRESLAMLRSRLGNLFCSVLAVPLVVLLILAAVAAGSAVLGLLSATLSVLWLIVVGLPLTIIATALLLLGVPATLLMLPAAALDCRESFETVSRSVSFVRARPGKFLVALLVAVFSALCSASVVALFVGFVAGILVTIHNTGFGWVSGWVGTVVESPAAWATDMTALEWVIACLAAASFMTALVAGVSRIYLYLRWDIDREPPGALIHVSERIEWADQ